MDEVLRSRSWARAKPFVEEHFEKSPFHDRPEARVMALECASRAIDEVLQEIIEPIILELQRQLTSEAGALKMTLRQKAMLIQMLDGAGVSDELIKAVMREVAQDAAAQH